MGQLGGGGGGGDAFADPPWQRPPTNHGTLLAAQGKGWTGGVSGPMAVVAICPRSSQRKPPRSRGADAAESEKRLSDAAV